MFDLTRSSDQPTTALLAEVPTLEALSRLPSSRKNPIIMNIRSAWFVLLVAPLLAQGSLWAQSVAKVLAISDADCDWKVDSVSQGRLKVDETKKIGLTPGKHLLQAKSLDGLDQWSTVISVGQTGQELVSIKLLPMRQRRQADMAHDRLEEQEYKKHPAWTDPKTSLTWVREDNGDDVNWEEATVFCENLRLGGYSNWQLPSIEELAGLYDPSQNVKGQRVKGGISLTGWSWSGDHGTTERDAWLFLFRFGVRASFPIGESSHLRAFCVHRPGK
jgi:hypothetical protein